MIHQLAAVLRALDLFGHGKAHSVGDALTKRAGGGFHGVDQEVFRVARGERAHLAEVLHLLKRDLFVTHEIEQGVDQHGAVASRQDETVAVGPVWRGNVKLHVLFKQHCRHIRHAHRHARVTGVCSGNRIQCQSTNGGGFHPMFRVLFTQGGDVHVLRSSGLGVWLLGQ